MWMPFLCNVLSTNAAEAVAKAHPTLAHLADALRQNPRAIEDLPMNTASTRRVGPAQTAKLASYLSSRDPDVKLG